MELILAHACKLMPLCFRQFAQITSSYVADNKAIYIYSSLVHQEGFIKMTTRNFLSSGHKNINLSFKYIWYVHTDINCEWVFGWHAFAFCMQVLIFTKSAHTQQVWLYSSEMWIVLHILVPTTSLCDRNWRLPLQNEQECFGIGFIFSLAFRELNHMVTFSTAMFRLPAIFFALCLDKQQFCW